MHVPGVRVRLLAARTGDSSMSEPHPQHHPLTLQLEVESLGPYGGFDVFLSGIPLGRRKYDGSDGDDVAEEVARELAGLLRERLGWPDEAHEVSW
jgi:hypothetical protein